MQRVAGTLAGVQAQVAKEAVVWRTGPLVMAPLVKLSLAAAQVALLPLAMLLRFVHSFVQSTVHQQLRWVVQPPLVPTGGPLHQTL